MLFDNRSVYLGASKEKYEQYCKALEAERIKYMKKKWQLQAEEHFVAWAEIQGQIKHCTKSWSEGKTTIMQWEF